MGNNKLLIIIACIGVYLLSTGASYSIFSKSSSSLENISPVDTKKTNEYGALEFDSSGPKTEACPLNGEKYTKQQKKWWEGHRPLGVMIENSLAARPQSGIGFADVVYEAIAEGGITRFLAVYYCQDAGIVGPVRSARTYFLDEISEYGSYPLYAHVGGANTPGPADALGQIVDYGWNTYNDLNQFSIGYPTFKRDESRLGHPVATEHTMYSTTGSLWAVGVKRGLTDKDKEGDSWDANFVSWSFKSDLAVSDRPASQMISMNFWTGQPDYNVVWKYDKTTNSYLRNNGGQPHLDNNTKEQLKPKNVVILYMKESRANDGYEGNLHELFVNKGIGNALVFQDGKQIKATWHKASREGRTELTVTSTGKDVEFNPGQIWVQIIPTYSDVVVE